MALNFPSGVPSGTKYTGDNGITYVFDGIRWIGYSSKTLLTTTNAILNNGYVVQVDASGSLVLPQYTLPVTTGSYGQVLTWPFIGSTLTWTSVGGGGSTTSLYLSADSITFSDGSIQTTAYNQSPPWVLSSSSGATVSISNGFFGNTLEVSTGTYITFNDPVSGYNGATVLGVIPTNAIAEQTTSTVLLSLDDPVSIYGPGVVISGAADFFGFTGTAITLGYAAQAIWSNSSGGQSGKIEVKAGQKAWIYDYSGNVTFPDGTVQTTAFTGSASTSTLVNGSYTVRLNTDGKLTLPGGIATLMAGYPGYSDTSYIATLVGTEAYVASTDGTKWVGINADGNGEISTGGKIWTFGQDGTTQFPNDTIKAPTALSIATPTTSGIPASVANWNGGGGWNQGYYNNLATTGGSGTGLTVNVAAGGGGYINITAITIHTPGSGYNDGDVITINNENNIPGTFTITTRKNTWQFGTDGGLTFPDSSVQTTAFTGTSIPVLGNFAFSGNTLSNTLSDAITLQVGGNSWTFGTNGGLTFPDSSVQTTAFTGLDLSWPVNNTTGTSGPVNIAIGQDANAGTQSVVIGGLAGSLTPGQNVVSIGYQAGYNSQGDYSVAVGASSGSQSQGIGAIALGNSAGSTNQGINAIAIGANAGYNYQSPYAIAIGANAGFGGSTPQSTSTIIINATSNEIDGVPNQTNSFYVAPIRNATTDSGVLYYNPTTFEVTYGTSPTLQSTAASTAPANPNLGDIWYDTSTDIVSEYINDGIGSYWVDVDGPTVANVNYVQPPSRISTSTTTTVLSAGTTVTTILNGFKGYAIYSLRVSTASWVVLYSSTATMIADASRSIVTDPAVGSGVLAEAITTSSATLYFSPALFGYSSEAVPNTNIPIKVYNNGTVSTSITVTITILKLES